VIITHSVLHHSLPVHCLNAFPENPGGHWQVKPPGVLAQMALAPQRPEGPLTLSHSSTSVKTNRIYQLPKALI